MFDAVRLVAGAAGILGLIAYAAGVAILLARLLLLHLPITGVVGAIPRTAAIADGAMLALGPAIALAVVYASWRFARSGARPPVNAVRFHDVHGSTRGRWIAEAILIGLLIGALPVIRVWCWHGRDEYWAVAQWAVTALIVVLVAVAVPAYMHGRARIAEVWPLARADPSKGGAASSEETILPGVEPPAAATAVWSRPLPVLLNSMIFAALLTVPFTAMAASSGLPRAVVCVKEADGVTTHPVQGALIAQTPERVYLGVRDDKPSAQGRLKTFAGDTVDRVVIGEHAHTTDSCRAREEAPPPPDTEPVRLTFVPLLSEVVEQLDRMWGRHHAAHVRAWNQHHPKR